MQTVLAFYSIIEILFQYSGYDDILDFTIDIYPILLYGLILIFLANFGSTTTSEAKETLILIAKSMNQTDDAESKLELKSILRSIKTRNTNLQTIFFDINWSVLLTVSDFSFVFQDNIFA
jgi:hypothetical protein